MIARLVSLLLLALLWAMLFVAFAFAADAVPRDRNCNPYTYGRPHSCHAAPVERTGRVICFKFDGELVCLVIPHSGSITFDPPKSISDGEPWQT